MRRDARGRFVAPETANYETLERGWPRWRVTEPNGERKTVYVHQVLACVDHDPRRVFDPRTEVHHRDGVRWHNAPENVEVREADEHGDFHLNGQAFADEAGGSA